jgi:heat shock protein HslJ
MKKWLMALFVFTSIHACQSSQKTKIQKSKNAFNESLKNKDEKLMLQAGIDFFAEGNQPTNWKLQMDYDDTVRFNADDGLSLKFAHNQLQKNINNESSIFSTKLKAGNIIITVLENDCSVSTNEKNFKKEVTFNFNNNVYRGCGKFLADNELNNKWILEKIGGNIINELEYNSLPFFTFDIEQRNLRGSDGCNNINTTIEVQGSRIKFGNIMSTQMACSKKSIEVIISKLINNNITSYYFKDGKLFLYLIDDSLIIFKKG